MGDWADTLRLLHVLSASVLFGTRLGGAFYLWRADRGGDMAVIGSVASNVVVAEALVITPAVIVQLGTGLALAQTLGLPLATPWLAGGLALFAAIGVVWVPLVWLELRIARLAAGQADGVGRGPAPWARHMRLWHALEWPVLALVIGIFALMVFRPAAAG